MKLLRLASIKIERIIRRKVSRPPLKKKKENVHATINHSRDRVSGALDKIQLAHHYKSRQPLYPNRSYPWGTLETSIRKRRKPTLLRGWIHPAAPPSPPLLSLSHTPTRERFHLFFFLPFLERESWISR